MNSVKLAEEAFIFKMDMESFDKLYQEEDIYFSTSLAGKTISISLISNAEISKFSAKWNSIEEMHLILHIPHEDLEALQEKGRNKHGISYDVLGNTISLQIDVRDFKRKM